MLIAIEGCLGVGKSTVAKGLVAVRQSTLLLEEFESNPFLRAFYSDPEGNAIETEFAFLMLHFHQLKSVAQTVTSGEIVADFHLGKDVLYAELNIKDPRLRRVFGELYQLCSEQIPAPDLLVFLSADTKLLIERIQSRNRDFELMIDPKYYEAVNTAYEDLFVRYSGRKIRIDMEQWDFVREPTLYQKLNALVDSEARPREHSR